MDKLDPRTAAFVAIDLQAGILAMPLAPYSGADILARGAALAKRFRELNAVVALTNVTWAADFADVLKQPVDRPMRKMEGGLPPGFADLGPELDIAPTDILITKRQWSAFHGTELDLQLRRRGIKTVVLSRCGIQYGCRIHRPPGLGIGLSPHLRRGRYQQRFGRDASLRRRHDLSAARQRGHE
jgi:nicotinamidase-related amidase